MSLNNVQPGSKIPDQFNVIIEIPMNADPIKYEVDEDSGALFVDRFMGTAMHYPCNYGYIPNTLSDDGDPVDVLVINHGVNVHGNRSPEAVLQSLEVNALSSWRLLELFAALPSAPGRCREIWVNTSEAEIQAAVSPLYEISKRLQGQLLHRWAGLYL